MWQGLLQVFVYFLYRSGTFFHNFFYCSAVLLLEDKPRFFQGYRNDIFRRRVPDSFQYPYLFVQDSVVLSNSLCVEGRDPRVENSFELLYVLSYSLFYESLSITPYVHSLVYQSHIVELLCLVLARLSLSYPFLALVLEGLGDPLRVIELGCLELFLYDVLKILSV